MHAEPEDLADDRLAGAVAAHWSVQPQRLDYAPVGFGSYHWKLVDTSGDRWFVTADRVADDPAALQRHRAALLTSRLLADQGLGFVLAPVPGRDDEVITIVGPYAVCLHPFHDHDGAGADAEQRLQMIIAIHACTSRLSASPAADGFELPGRDLVEQGLRDPDGIGDTGPFATGYAELLRQHHDRIAAALHRFDTGVTACRQDRSGWVITHGEPKANNTMITESGPLMIDWESTRLAPPARDLWLVEDPGAVERYRATTGRAVPAEELELYRLRWDLADLCSFGSWFARPHRRTADTELGWQGCRLICDRL